MELTPLVVATPEEVPVPVMPSPLPLEPAPVVVPVVEAAPVAVPPAEPAPSVPPTIAPTPVAVQVETPHSHVGYFVLAVILLLIGFVAGVAGGYYYATMHQVPRAQAASVVEAQIQAPQTPTPDTNADTSTNPLASVVINPFDGTSTALYPIAPLGGCGSQSACKTYCDSQINGDACFAYGEAHGLMTLGQVAQEKKLRGLVGPGGCDGIQYKAFCQDGARHTVCFEFAKQNGLVTSTP